MGVTKGLRKNVQQNGHIFGAKTVTCTERYSGDIRKAWSKLSDFVCRTLTTIAMFVGAKKRPGKNIQQNGHIFDPMAVTWTEKHNASIEKVWNKMPNFVRQVLATVAIFMLGTSMSGKNYYMY